MSYNVYKALHIIAMVTWFAGLFYLPRIFVYHAMNKKEEIHTSETFKIMERKLLIMTNIGGIMTIAFGLILLFKSKMIYLTMPWMHIKLTLVALLLIYHGFCYYYVLTFRADRNRRSHKFFRFFNELPTILLIAIVLLAVTKMPTL